MAAAVALDPVRSRLRSELAKPTSAATLANRLGISRQKINYHLRALESRATKALLTPSAETERRVPRLSIEGVIRFRYVPDRAAFTQELTHAI